MTYSEIVSFLWSVADLIRDTFKRGKYQDVILPFTVLRRIDCVLAPEKPRVLEEFLGIHRRTLQRELRKLVEEGFLRERSSSPSDPTKHYELRSHDEL